MAPLAGLSALVAHGGLAGAIVEALIVVAVAGGLIAIWLRERRARSSGAAELDDEL